MKQSKAEHPGHNPMAALVMLAIIFTALLSALSGMLIIASGETGMFGFTLTAGTDPEIFEELHESVVNVFLGLVGLHLAGLIADTLFHRENRTIFSIFTGYKQVRAKDVSLTLFQKMFAVLWFAIPLVMFFYVLGFQPMPADQNNETEQVIKNEQDDD